MKQVNAADGLGIIPTSSFPNHGVGSFVLGLALRHGVKRTIGRHDGLARLVTSFAGDDVVIDDVQAVIYDLCRALVVDVKQRSTCSCGICESVMPMALKGMMNRSIFLVKPLTGERWNIKYIDWSDDLRSFTDSEGGRVHVICSLELVGECEDFVIERAKRIFLESAKMGVSDHDDRWNWMTFTERTEWRALAIDAIQSEQEVFRRGRSMAERYKDR